MQLEIELTLGNRADDFHELRPLGGKLLDEKFSRRHWHTINPMYRLTIAFALTLAVGQPAPDFTLRDQNAKSVSLSAARSHKVVLVFYRGYW